MQEFYKERLDILKNGEGFTLAAIYDSKGSTPRTIGARMIIRKDGSIIGTVGGGKIEALVIQDGRILFEKKNMIQKKYKLQEANNKGIGMACGGDVSILMEYVDNENIINIETYERVVNCVEKGEKAFLIRKFSNDGSKMNYLFKSGEVISNANDFEKEDIKKYVNTVRYRDLVVINEEDAMVIIEPICNLGRLYLFGAGHVSQKLAELAKKIDFLITVIDDRAEFASIERFPTADEIIVSDSFKNCFQNLPIDNDSYIAILTRGHIFDLTVLKQSLRTNAFYIGMIGSRRKRDIVYNSLKEDGFTIEDFRKVHNPIGIEIGAETPEEIAVSISAELIKVRRERMQ